MISCGGYRRIDAIVIVEIKGLIFMVLIDLWFYIAFVIETLHGRELTITK